MMLPHKQAQDYLLIWYESELTYFRDFQKWKCKPNLDWEYQDSFGKALYYFMVHSWIRHERVQNLMSLTFDWVHGPDPDDVDQFGESLRQLRDVRETDLASKILFLNNPQKLPPTSEGVRAAVGLEAKIYKEYQPRFVRFREDHHEEIQHHLAEIAPRLSVIENKFKDDIENLDTVRINRYTDQLLRGIGRELLHKPGPPFIEPREPKPKPGDEFSHPYVDPSRISELRAIKSARYDLTKLVDLCEELNSCYANECFLAVAMIVRTILNHVPPIFGFQTFKAVLENYGVGDRTFDALRRSMELLQTSSRNIADAHLHMVIRDKETLPNRVQVNFTNDLDFLLAEVVRILKR